MHSKNSLLLARSMIATDMHRTIKHSEAQYESTLCVQLANANKVPCVVYTVIDRVSALLIRWSRVRVSPDPPLTAVIDIVETISHSSAQSYHAHATVQTLKKHA